MPHSLSRDLNRHGGTTIILEYEERPVCKHCHQPMKITSRSKPRLVIGLHENYEIVTTYYQCGKFPCPGEFDNPVHPENPHVAPHNDYDFDVMAKVCEYRWKHKQTYDEIVENMENDFGILINRSSIEMILKTYEIGCAERYKPKYVEEIQKFGGIILTVDGMQPLKGNKGIYAARDHRTGLKLGSRILPNQKAR